MKPRLILIGVLAAIVVAGAWFFLLWKPASNDLDQAKADRAAAEAEAQSLQVRLNHLKRLERNAEVLQRDRDLLRTAIPEADKLDEFILQVNERAARAGVSFVSVAPSQPGSSGVSAGPPAEEAVNISMSIQATGEYFSLLRFMEELRDGPRLFTVDSFTMSPGGGDAGQMSISVGARMFMNPSVDTAALPTTSA